MLEFLPEGVGLHLSLWGATLCYATPLGDAIELPLERAKRHCLQKL